MLSWVLRFYVPGARIMWPTAGLASALVRLVLVLTSAAPGGYGGGEGGEGGGDGDGGREGLGGGGARGGRRGGHGGGRDGAGVEGGAGGASKYTSSVGRSATVVQVVVRMPHPLPK
jgi:hypothetical protein